MLSTVLRCAIAVTVGAMASAQPRDAESMVSEANQAFAGGRYQPALDAYTAAQTALPESPELWYNRGAALYKLGDLAAAHAAFGRALSTHNAELEARIKFNLGNVTFASALRDKSNLPKAMDLLKNSIRHYRDAIELNPDDGDALVNIEVAHRLLTELLDEFKKARETEQERPVAPEDRQEDEQGQGNGGAMDGEQSPDAQQDPAREQPRADERLTREEGERLLQAVRDKERQRCEQVARRQRAGRAPALKDW